MFSVVAETKSNPTTLEAEANFGHEVYGWASLGVAHLVVDRHRTDHALTHTTMHELLHLLGVMHVSGNTHAIMARQSDANEEPLTLSLEDKIEIAHATGCDPR